MRRRRTRPGAGLGLVALALAVAAAGCRGGGGAVTLRVFAAASLTEALSALAPAFEASRPGVEVQFSFAGSSSLVRQLDQGAPGDVLVTADGDTMAAARAAGLVGPSQVVARNRLALVVAAGNPLRVTGLGDLARPELTVVLCAPEVPCGRLAVLALERVGVRPAVASLEENVKAVVARIALGEADAGVVYATDVRAAGARVSEVAVTLPPADDADLQAIYPMAVASATAQRAMARAFVDFVAGPAGQAALAGAGFLPP